MPLYFPPAAGGSGDVATDSIWDAAGDLAVGSGANTAAKLTKGTAGYRLEAGASGLIYAAKPLIVARTTDSSALTSQTTPQADDTLKWAVSGNETDIWFFEVFCNFACATAGQTMDLTVAWTMPANTTIRYGIGHVGANTSVPGFSSTESGSIPASILQDTADFDHGMRTAAHNFFHASGWAYVGDTAGDITFCWSQATSDANDLVLQKGSFLSLIQVV